MRIAAVIVGVAGCRGGTGDGAVCDDPVAVCGENAACSVVDGDARCDCDDGFVDDGGGCVDVDECATDNGGCGDPARFTCENALGGPPTCGDVDECATDNGGCDATFETCVNRPGAAPTCADIDECATDNGGCGPALYWTCTDNAGAAPDCEDVDSCATNNGGCGAATFWTCTDRVGAAPTCTDIDECATDNGGCGPSAFWTCTDNEGAGPTCTDIDECATDNGGCGPSTFWTCTDNVGAAPSCADIDECALNNGMCGPSTFWTCTDNEGAAPTCTDIDECAADNGGCGDATFWRCTDNDGAGPTCTDIDECATDNGGCGPAAYWDCTDRDGATPLCADVAECDADNGGCGDSTYFTCTENEGAPPDCADAECATDGGFDDPGSACDGGVCLEGACLAEVAVNASVNLTTTPITPGRTCAEAPQYAVSALAGDGATVTSAPVAGCLDPGDEVLLIHLQGTPGHTDNVGNWELFRVAAIDGAQVTFDAQRTQFYGDAAGSDAGIGTGASDQKVALIRVPSFDALTVGSGGVITASGFSGATGGVVALRATLLTVRGQITASGIGYRSGRWSLGSSSCNNNVATESGESITGPAVVSTARNGGAPGGISVGSSSFHGNTPISPSAGHAVAGVVGVNGGTRTLGQPGEAYGVNDGSRLTMGSGPSGNLTCDTVTGAPVLFSVPTYAGGVVLLTADTLVVDPTTGAITATALQSGRDTSASGGYVLLRGGDLSLGTGRVTARGGTAVSGSPTTSGQGNASSPGYIVIDASGTVTGTTDPPANALAP